MRSTQWISVAFMTLTSVSSGAVELGGPNVRVNGDNRNVNPTANALEDDALTTQPPELINVRSRDSNVYFQKIRK